MNPIDYAAMTDQELKRYFLAHRQDTAALQAYLDRRRERPKEVIASANDPDFDRKIQTAIRQQIATHQRDEQGEVHKDR